MSTRTSLSPRLKLTPLPLSSSSSSISLKRKSATESATSNAGASLTATQQQWTQYQSDYLDVQSRDRVAEIISDSTSLRASVKAYYDTHFNKRFTVRAKRDDMVHALESIFINNPTLRSHLLALVSSHILPLSASSSSSSSLSSASSTSSRSRPLASRPSKTTSLTTSLASSSSSSSASSSASNKLRLRNVPTGELVHDLYELVFGFLTTSELASLTTTPPQRHVPDDVAYGLGRWRDVCAASGTCEQTWRAAFAGYYRRKLVAESETKPREGKKERKREIDVDVETVGSSGGGGGDGDDEKGEVDVHRGSEPKSGLCKLLCVMDVSAEALGTLMQAYVDEIQSQIHDEIVFRNGDSESNVARPRPYYTEAVWELGKHLFVFRAAASETVFGRALRVDIDLEYTTRPYEPEVRLLIMRVNFTIGDNAEGMREDAWDKETKTWAYDREAQRLKLPNAAAVRAHRRQLAEKEYKTIRDTSSPPYIIALRTFMDAEMPTLLYDSNVNTMQSVGFQRYAYQATPTSANVRALARVVRAVSLAFAKTLVLTPAQHDTSIVPSPLPSFLEMSRRAFPSLPIRVLYVDKAHKVPNRFVGAFRDQDRHWDVKIKGNQIKKLVAASKAVGVSNIKAISVRILPDDEQKEDDPENAWRY